MSSQPGLRNRRDRSPPVAEVTGALRCRSPWPAPCRLGEAVRHPMGWGWWDSQPCGDSCSGAVQYRSVVGAYADGDDAPPPQPAPG